MDLPVLTISFLTILFTIIILTIFKIFTRPSPQKSPPSPQKLPPGPQKLPLIGNLHQLALKATVPHRRLAELARTYGPIMHLQVGEVPTVIISSADVAREAMMTQDAVFCNRPTLMVAKELFYDCTDIGLAPYGEYWRQARKISTLELFTLKRVGSFRRVREEETANLVEFIASRVGSVVNLSNKLFGLTFNITSRTTFSKKGKDQEAFQALTTKISQAAASFSVADLYPSLEWIIPSISGIKRKFQKLVHESNIILDPIIEEHKGKKKVGNEKEDLVDVLLKFHKDNVNEEDEFSLTTNNIKAIILELFVAGSETSSSLAEWVMSEMIKNPRVMEKAQNEVRQIYQLQGVVDEMKLDELKYLELVIKETLRLHPPLPLLPPRESMKICQLNDYEIPSKTRVLINVWAIGRDPKYWTKPESFVPERFEDSSTDYKGTHFEYIPFGAGRRRCPGMALGIANVRLPLANLLYHFDWKLPSTIKQPEDLNMDESFGITMRRKHELLVIPTPHN